VGVSIEVLLVPRWIDVGGVQEDNQAVLPMEESVPFGVKQKPQGQNDRVDGTLIGWILLALAGFTMLLIVMGAIAAISGDVTSLSTWSRV
jgi:hypothetical protein